MSIQRFKLTVRLGGASWVGVYSFTSEQVQQLVKMVNEANNNPDDLNDFKKTYRELFPKDMIIKILELKAKEGVLAGALNSLAESIGFPDELGVILETPPIEGKKISSDMLSVKCVLLE